jgi:hypothetical protein
MKRIAAILCLGGVLALGAGSQAAASGDPVAVDQCFKPVGCLPVVSAQQITGPQLGDLVCTPSSQIGPLTVSPADLVPIFNGPFPPAAYEITVCKQ